MNVAIKRLKEGVGMGKRMHREGILHERVSSRGPGGFAHPNIVAVHHVFALDGSTCIVMDLVEGKTLAGWLQTDPSAAHRLRVLVGILHAMTYVHRRGVLHRDLKPANILVDGAGRPRVTDFGLARYEEPSANTSRLTQFGQIMGTPGYCAPEQAYGQPVGFQADVFSLACLAVETLRGRPLFLLTGMSAWDRVLEYRRALTAPADLDGVPPELSDALRDALQPEPAARPGTAGELLSRLFPDTPTDVSTPDVAPLPRADDDGLRAALRAHGDTDPDGLAVAMRLHLAIAGPGSAVYRDAAASFVRLHRPDLAHEALDASPPDHDTLRLRALASARAGQEEAARRILELLVAEGAADSETLALLAGRYKREWYRTDNVRWHKLALVRYGEAAEGGDPYAGINVASLRLQAGDADGARAVAAAVLEAITTEDVWALATRAEARHILGLEAVADYEAAASAAGARHGDIASMRLQARRNAVALGEDRTLFDAILPVPKVAAAAGHRIDRPGRDPPRFPARLAPRVQSAIRKRIRANDVRIGVSSLADGADLLFALEVLAAGGQLTVVLPFPRDAFERTSVHPGARADFRRVLAAPATRLVTLSTAPPQEGALVDAFAAAWDVVQEIALTAAGVLDETPFLLLVVDDEGPGDDLSRYAHERWTTQGLPVDPIYLSALT